MKKYLPLIHDLIAGILFVLAFTLIAAALTGMTGCSAIQFQDGPVTINRYHFLNDQKIAAISIEATPNGKTYTMTGYTNDETEVVKAAIIAAGQVIGAAK